MINVVKVKDKYEGQVKAHDLLKKLVDKNTLLVLSGGTSVDYKTMLTDPNDVIPGAVCVVDERFGSEFHKDSNELLMRNAGLIDHLAKRQIPFHKILLGKDLLATAKDYEETIEELFKKFAKKVGVMGVGTDLHTAGIFPFSVSAKSPDFVVAETVKDRFPKRITITLRALGEFTNFVIMMFGAQKKEAIKKLLDDSENDMQKFPAIFYRKVPIKSYLVTDITI